MSAFLGNFFIVLGANLRGAMLDKEIDMQKMRRFLMTFS